MGKIKSHLFLVLTWLFGTVLGCVCLLLRMVGLIKILHPERFPDLRKVKHVLVFARHPSNVDPFLVAVALFFRWFIFSLKYAPRILADEKNFAKNGLWKWLSEMMIPVRRGDPASEAGALRRMARILSRDKQSLLLFPGGGRESTGERRGEPMLLSTKGHKLRHFKPGAAWLARTEVLVVPVWVEGTEDWMPDWHFVWPRKLLGTVKIKVGQPIRFSRDQTVEEINGILEEALLRLADEEE